MALVAGVDFGTLSVRVSIFDSERGRLGSGVGEFPLQRKRDDPDHATQSHADHMRALVEATRALASAGVEGEAIEAIAVDTTGSSVVPVDENLEPLDDYYLWCDHRAWREAALITATANRTGLPAIEWCGGMYSSEWGFSKLLHWLRHNPEKRARFATALEHCDMIAATLCGIRDPRQVARCVCAMGHKWMWNAALGGLPPEEFLDRGRSAAGGCAGPAGGPLCHQRPDRRPAVGGVGGAAGPARRHPDSDGRLRRPLGRDRRGRPARRRGERGRHVHLHHGDSAGGEVDSGRVRRGARLHPSRDGGNRSGTLGHRRHLRCDRPARRHDGGRAVPRTGELHRRRDRSPAADLGQRRPDGPGEPGTERHHARLAPDAPSRRTNCSRRSKEPPSTRA